MIGWTLSALVFVALVIIGIAALVAPRASSSQYGIVTADPRALALIRAMGVRDVVLGALVALLALQEARGALVWAMLALALVAVVDLGLVMADRRASAATRAFDGSCRLHAAGVIGLLLTAAILHAGP